MGMNPGDFPELPSPGADHTLDLETPTFREMVETTLFAVSQDDKKPAHTGELFAIEPDKLTVVCLLYTSQGLSGSSALPSLRPGGQSAYRRSRPQPSGWWPRPV